MKRPRAIKRKYFSAEVSDSSVLIECVDNLSPRQCRKLATFLFKAALYLDKNTPIIKGGRG